MTVVDAVQKAKSHLFELLQSEGITNLGLEEVEFDDDSKVWSVTLGFSRSWDDLRSPLEKAGVVRANLPRTYKLVKIEDESGKAVALKNREFQR